MDTKAPLSVVIITKNEEARIKDCLESVKWANEIIVLDDYSTDKTVQIARQYTDKVFQRKMDIEGRHRNYAYSLAKNKWILSLDADERVTPELKEELAEIVARDPPINGFAIPRRNYIGDLWVKHGGWYPSAQLKFFRKDKFKWEEVEVHPKAFMDDPRGQLKNDIIHYSYKDFEDFSLKIDNQTMLEAKKWIKDKRKMNFFKAYWRAFDRFVRTLILKKSFLDGLAGLKVAYFAYLYQVKSYKKYRGLKLRYEQ